MHLLEKFLFFTCFKNHLNKIKQISVLFRKRGQSIMQLAYKKIGHGKPLIILHGLFGMSDNWLTIAKKIARRHTVYLLDQRNHGRSPHAEEFNYDVLSDDLECFIRDQGLDQVRLIGHSLGGKVAMCYALKHPDRVEKLVIVDIAPRSYDHPFFHNVLKFMIELDLKLFKTRQEIDEEFKTIIPGKAVRQFILKNLDRADDQQFRWKINVQSLYQNLFHIFKEISNGRQYDQPVLFVRGGASDYIVDSDEPQIRKLFPQAKIVTIPGASHWLHVEAEEALCDHLRAYL